MRIAALIFGLLAGVLAGLVLAFGNVEASLAAVLALGSESAPVARFVVYLVPAIGWIGAGLVLARPRLGGLVLLLSAVGWAALAFAAGHGAVLFAAAPFTFAAAAGLVALFAHRGIAREARRAASPSAPSPKRAREVPPPRFTPPPRPQPAPQSPPIVTAEPSEPEESFAAPLISPPFRDEIPDEPVGAAAKDDAVAPIIAAMATQTLPDAPAGAAEAVEAPTAESVPLPIASSPVGLTATTAAAPAAPAAAAALLTAPVAPIAGADEGASATVPAETAVTSTAPPAGPASAPSAADLRARRPGDWSLPSPADLPPPRYAAERQGAPDTVVSPPLPAPDQPATPGAAAQPTSNSEAAVPPPASEPPPPLEAAAAATLDFAPADDYGRGHRPAAEANKSPSAGVAAAREPFRRPLRGRRAGVPARPPARPAAGLRSLLRGAIAAIFVIVVIGGAGAVYLDYLRGPQSILFGRRVPVTTEKSQVTPVARAAATAGQPPARTQAPPKPAATTPATPELAPAHPASAAPDKPASAAPSTPAAPLRPASTTPSIPVPTTSPAPANTVSANSAAPASVQATATAATTATPTTSAAAPAPAATASTAAAAPAAPPAATAQTFTDPVRYCVAVGTIDAPDSRFTGPAVPPAVDRALLLPDSIEADQVHWRCSGGVALACNANHTDACALTPTVQEMLQYCAKHPGAASMPAPNGSWSCNGTRPVIPENQSWPVDAQGFFPDAWVRVSPLGAG